MKTNYINQFQREIEGWGECSQPSQQQPAEGEKELPPGKWVKFPKGTFDKNSDVEIYILDKPKATHLYQVCTCPIQQAICPIHGMPQQGTLTTSSAELVYPTISPTEEELEREAEQAFPFPAHAQRALDNEDANKIVYYQTIIKSVLHKREGYLAAAKRYTRQGGEDWEALYISEHLNLLTAKGRIAQLEQQWISVEERLPEKAGCYIVYEKETNIETLYFTGTHFQNAFEEVTHWQRLPSPPNTKQVK